MTGGLSRRKFMLTSAAGIGGAIMPGRVVAAATAPAGPAAMAGTPMFADASAPAPAPETGVLQMGSSAAGTAPSGRTLTVNSQYFVLDGQPWLPVAGEFHYSRYPASLWETELLKMKAAGAQVVSAYVIWIHHQEIQGRFDFTGDRDLRRFVQLCGQHGLQAIVRIGPWVHAEVRNGGLPDWVLAQSTKTRSNDPVYMGFVTSFWSQVAGRISDLIWKAGGPVIGVQLENEYHSGGSGQGAAHIATLKSLAISLGLDVPLYTVTGWQGSLYPAYQVVPCFGGYQDAPWDTTLNNEPPNETYSFRFFSREGGEYGYPDHYAGGYDPNTQAGLASYPFFGVEYGGGTASMYRRRCDMALPDDIAATIGVQLGSGVNMYGYYMFHGGRNPRGKTETLQESNATGGYNDLPVTNYDYQALIGQYGEQRPSLSRVKAFHYFLNEFGPGLAAMSSRQPAQIANGAGDLAALRWSVRSDGQSGYLFVNNYVRQYAMAAHPGTQFQVKFASETITFPRNGADIAPGAYFIWPLNLAIGDALLKYATAQPITSVSARGRTTYVFVAQAGIDPEFAFASDTVVQVRPGSGRAVTPAAGQTVVSGITPGLDSAVSVTTKAGKTLDLVVITQQQADELWRVRLGETDFLILTPHQLGLTPDGFSLTSPGSPEFSFAAYPQIPVPADGGTIRRDGQSGIFTAYRASQKAQEIPVTVSQTRAPGLAPPVATGGQAHGALEPTDPVIAAVQGEWEINVPWDRLGEVADAILTIGYAGDLARLYSGSQALDDNFYDGQEWTISLGRLAAETGGTGPLTLAVMPLRSDAPIYLQAGDKPLLGSNGQACAVSSLTAVPVYRLDITAPGLGQG